MRQKREWLVVSGVCHAHWTVHMKATSSSCATVCIVIDTAQANELSKVTPSQIVHELLGRKRHRPHTASPQSIQYQRCR